MSKEVLQGTLDLMVLTTLDTMGPQHGFGLAKRILQISDGILNLNQGTLYPALIRLEQRGWIKGRDECWKSNDRRACVEGEYERRIAELQARYRLVPSIGPVTFVCDGDPREEFVAWFFQTEPSTMIAERGGSVSLMYVQPSGSGARYQGRNESFWEHQGEASVTWGYGAPEMRCKKVP